MGEGEWGLGRSVLMQEVLDAGSAWYMVHGKIGRGMMSSR